MEKQHINKLYENQTMNDEKFIFCLEAVSDEQVESGSETFNNLQKLAFDHRIDSIYKTCDSIEGFEESLDSLLHNDHNFKHYEIIYLIMEGTGNDICINDFLYSLEEIAEIFEGRMKDKIVHFSNAMTLNLAPDEAQYFLAVTGARAISGYGASNDIISSSRLDSNFFSLCQEYYDLVDIVEHLHARNYNLCKLLDFRLYY